MTTTCANPLIDSVQFMHDETGHFRPVGKPQRSQYHATVDAMLQAYRDIGYNVTPQGMIAGWPVYRLEGVFGGRRIVLYRGIREVLA